MSDFALGISDFGFQIEANMSEIISSQSITLPLPSAPMSVRVGTREDVPFMDALQKLNRKALGFFPRAQMEAYIDAGNVLVAEVAGSSQPSACSLQPSACSELNPASCKPEAVGYCIAKDRYLKRDELGAVFQLCVAPGRERGFIGANLLREVFERAAYGCKLFCCWCAQDLPANKFWEAMGFVPIAYRAGGKARSSQPAVRSDDAPLKAGSCKLKASPRIHIFWQKRIRAGDTSTPYWFPAKTEGGAIREDRIILPIPPGMRWDEELPVLMGEREGEQYALSAVEGRSEVRVREEGDVSTQPSAVRIQTFSPRPQTVAPKRETVPMTRAKPAPIAPKRNLKVCLTSATRFAAEAVETAEVGPVPESLSRGDGESVVSVGKRASAHRDPLPKAHASPQLIAKARELRDRWMDHVSANGIEQAGGDGRMPGRGKYDVTRTIQRMGLADEPKRLAA